MFLNLFFLVRDTALHHSVFWRAKISTSPLNGRFQNCSLGHCDAGLETPFLLQIYKTMPTNDEFSCFSPFRMVRMLTLASRITNINSLMFTPQDLAFIVSRGSDQATVEKQIENFQHGFPFLPLVAAAKIGDGIVRLTDDEAAQHMANYEEKIGKGLAPLKFVPASGAASRMFKALFEAKDKLQAGASEQSVLANQDMATFNADIKKFAFYADLSTVAGKPAEQLSLLEKLNYLLGEKGLNYGVLPKGLLQFHRYSDCSRSSFEEHCVEGASYAQDRDGKVAIHFTVSPEHQAKFEEHMQAVIGKYAAQFHATYSISFSCQKSATDTIAVAPNNDPFRTDDGNLLFRPAGHGALIANLNELDADVIFVKNIDNVVPDHLKAETIRYKKALAGLLLHMQSQVYRYQEAFDHHLAGEMTEEYLNQAALFLESKLHTKLPEGMKQAADKYRFLKAKFNRPLRVCGMVKNEGEPGGGPFWASQADGSISLQVVESSQINFADAQQSQFAQEATHFNPVDLICATKNYRGEAFDLLRFVDPSTGFISSKSQNGKELKAQELPGLWNGAMANWNTCFVEVPVATFNPVKTVLDLLRKEHQEV